MTLDPLDRLLEAASFAARAHRNQVRKDGETPYFAHTARVCLIVRQVFGIADPDVLATALLHDTIEDTTTDFDDLAERFGTEIAGWVGMLSKDTRSPEEPREAAYHAVLAGAPWQVVVCKLADIFDNLTDSRHLPTAKRERTVNRVAGYLDAMKKHLPAEAKAAFALTEQKLATVCETLSEFPEG